MKQTSAALREAADFINALTAHLSPEQGARLLDVTSGKSEHTHLLAGKGFSVTRLDLHEHEWRTPFHDNGFDYIFSLFTSLGSNDATEDNHGTIDMLACCLAHSGTLVVDYLNIYAAIRIHALRQIKHIDGVVYNISHWSDERYLYKRMAVYDPGKDAIIDWTEKVARLGLDDFYHLFASHGLRIVKTYGSYSMERFQPLYSPRLIMMVEKAG